MLRVTFHIVIGALVILMSPAASAIGFGTSTTRTTLGQPLDFSAALSLDVDEAAPAPNCVFADVYSGDAKVSSDKVRAVLEPATGNAPRQVRVITLVAIQEPVASIELTVGCGSHVSRRFVSFIDPAPVRLAETVEAESSPSASAPADARVAAAVDVAGGAHRPRRSRVAPVSGSAARVASRAQARRLSAARASTVRVAAASTPRSMQPAARTTRQPNRRTVVARAPAGSGPRLRLDAPVAAATTASAAAPLVASRAAPGTRIGAALAATAPLAAEPSASAAVEQNSAVAGGVQREHDRIQVLEAGLARLSSESKATQDTIGALRIRLAEAEDDRYGNGLVYALAGSTLFFLLLAAAFWALRPRQRRQARWFDERATSRHARVRAAPPPAERAPIIAPASEAVPLDAYASLSETRPAAYATSGYASSPGRDSVLEPTTIGGLEVTTVLGPEASRFYGEPASADAAGDTDASTIEALIDVEQQSEFFVVLGQYEAAIALLEHHVGGGACDSPLPYLKLLELHRRRSDRQAHARIRDEFNERFNTLAPDWSAAQESGRSLDAYPTTLARLQSLWPTPKQAMRVLDALIFRREPSAPTFDLPAYSELLMLHGVAGDLSGPVESEAGTVDLYLPLEDAAAPSVVALPVEAREFSVDLDVSQWPDAASANDLVIVRSAGRRGAA